MANWIVLMTDTTVYYAPCFVLFEYSVYHERILLFHHQLLHYGNFFNTNHFYTKSSSNNSKKISSLLYQIRYYVSKIHNIVIYFHY